MYAKSGERGERVEGSKNNSERKEGIRNASRESPGAGIMRGEVRSDCCVVRVKILHK